MRKVRTLTSPIARPSSASAWKSWLSSSIDRTCVKSYTIIIRLNLIPVKKKSGFLVTNLYLVVCMNVVTSRPAVFAIVVAGLVAMLPLEEVIHHGVILSTSRSLRRGRGLRRRARLGGVARSTQHHRHAG